MIDYALKLTINYKAVLLQRYKKNHNNAHDNLLII